MSEPLFETGDKVQIGNERFLIGETTDENGIRAYQLIEADENWNVRKPN